MTPSYPIVSDPFTESMIQYKAGELCRRSSFSRSDRDELEQAMRLYLLQKAHLFDPIRGNVAAFVTQVLKTWAAMELRFRKRDRRRESFRALSLESTPVVCDGAVTSLGAVLLDNDADRLTQVESPSRYEQVEQRDAITYVLTHLEPQDRDLIENVAAHGITATARALGVSWRQVANVVARIRRDFENAGFSGAPAAPRHR